MASSLGRGVHSWAVESDGTTWANGRHGRQSDSLDVGTQKLDLWKTFLFFFLSFEGGPLLAPGDLATSSTTPITTTATTGTSTTAPSPDIASTATFCCYYCCCFYDLY